jgi:hypothetical protein
MGAVGRLSGRRLSHFFLPLNEAPLGRRRRLKKPGRKPGSLGSAACLQDRPLGATLTGGAACTISSLGAAGSASGGGTT